MTALRSRPTIGFIGLGQMGKPMALNLSRADVDLLVSARNADAFPELSAAGARVAETFSDFSAADVVFLSLPGTEAVRTVLLGETGLVDVLKADAIVVDTSTMEHGATLQLHEKLSSRGLKFLDAPVSGMQSRAENATLTIMCGGDESVFKAVKPLLAYMGDNILHMGGAGSGQLTKLVNQLLFDVNCAAIAEILPMACKMGLDPEKAASVINSGTGRSYASEFFLPRILKNHFSDGYPLEAAYKDLVSAAELSARNCVPMPVLAAATATYQTALLRGHGKDDKGAMIRIFEELLQVKFRSTGRKENEHG